MHCVVLKIQFMHTKLAERLKNLKKFTTSIYITLYTVNIQILSMVQFNIRNSIPVIYHEFISTKAGVLIYLG